MEHMKWWGWGKPSVSFTHTDKPSLAPFIKKHIDADIDRAADPVPDLDTLPVPASQLPAGLRDRLIGIVGMDHVHTDDLDRVVHARGKSLRDLIKTRRGEFGRIPDAVIYPATEGEVEAILRAALDNNAVVIPFGGGSNIAGSLDLPSTESRSILSVDLGRLRLLLDIDDDSRLATVQAGVYGPDLEEQLNARGWTMGHFPDSFTHSTLGGWIATRSSGMQSDKYGDIGDIVKGLRVVTPTGVMVTRPVPSKSTGPSVNEMILGSEGRLGLITEATVQVHRLPEKREIIAYLYPSWSQGLRSMQAISESEAAPTFVRVSDNAETLFSFATQKKSSRRRKLKTKVQQLALKAKGITPDKMCLSFVGYEGSADYVEQQQQAVATIAKAHGAVIAGPGPGALYDQKKFDTPYIRDFLLDRGVIADVSETAAQWSKLAAVHDNVNKSAHDAFATIGVKGYIMCHLSHSYHGGACLYFTFACQAPSTGDVLDNYDIIKSAVQQQFIDSGATLSHHHAVGTEHAQWLEEDISKPGVDLVRGLLTSVDPGKNLNPGSIVAN